MIIMRLGLNNKSHQYRIFAKGFLVLILIYLLFHLFLSERSIPSLLILSHKHTELETRLSDLQSERDNMHDRVTRLRPETLDPDLVEEYAIEMLGHRGGDAIILLDGPQG